VSLRSYLQLFRAQTAPATVFSLVVPYLLAGGRDAFTFAALFALGHLLHFFSFGHNSLMDYWHDLKDPSKRHHPLPSGAIRLEDAHALIHSGLAATLALLATLLWFKSVNPALSLAFALMYVVLGHAYNDGLDHYAKHSWIPISLCFTALVGAGWSTAGGLREEVFMLLAWAFLTVLFQIAYEGNLKDLWNPAEKYNLLRRWAVFNEKGEPLGLHPAVSDFFTSVRLVANTFALAYLAVKLTAGMEAYNIWAVLVLLLATSTVEMWAVLSMALKARKITNRQRLLNLMGIAEAFEFFRLVSLLGVLGVPLIAYGLAWFVSANRLLWGTRFGPKV